MNSIKAFFENEFSLKFKNLKLFKLEIGCDITAISSPTKEHFIKLRHSSFSFPFKEAPSSFMTSIKGT